MRAISSISITLLSLLIIVCGGGCKQETKEKAPKRERAKESTVKLPQASQDKKSSFEKVLGKRKAGRKFSQNKVSSQDISQLLWAAYGKTVDAVTGATRTVPSAGGFYPLELYVVSEDGIFQYLKDNHELGKIKPGDYRENLSEAGLNQPAIAQAPLNIVIAGNPHLPETKYGERALRYVYLEAGHVAQNILLEAESLDLSSVTIGAFEDEAVKALLKLDQNLVPLYIIPIGYSKS